MYFWNDFFSINMPNDRSFQTKHLSWKFSLIVLHERINTYLNVRRIVSKWRHLYQNIRNFGLKFLWGLFVMTLIGIRFKENWCCQFYILAFNIFRSFKTQCVRVECHFVYYLLIMSSNFTLESAVFVTLLNILVLIKTTPSILSLEIIQAFLIYFRATNLMDELKPVTSKSVWGSLM